MMRLTLSQKFCECVISFVVIAGTFGPAYLTLCPSAESASPVEESKSPLKIERTYSEAALDDIFVGHTSQPASVGLEGYFDRFVEMLAGVRKNPPLGIGALEPENRKRENGFQVGEFKFGNEKLLFECRVRCGVINLGIRKGGWLNYQRMSFADAEKYLLNKLLRQPDGETAFEKGSFTGKPIGEAVWHRIDEKTRTYELISLRGLVIQHLRVTFKQDYQLQKTFVEKMDGMAQAWDEGMKIRMWSRSK